jgi:hypothetical protein
MISKKELITKFHERSQQINPEYPLTRLQISRAYWLAIKANPSTDFEAEFSNLLTKHEKYIKSRLKNSTFTATKLGTVKITSDFEILIQSIEHADLFIKTQNGSAKWVTKTLNNYCKQQCCQLINGTLWSKLDLSK